MRKTLFALAFLSLPLSLQAADTAEKNAPSNSVSPSPDYQLEQVVMLSRHGIRAPLIGYGSALVTATPYEWVNWKTEGGHLTLKGGKLEGLFAQYIDNWLSEEGLIPAERCPQTEVFIYTNSLPRTIESGSSFVAGAYPNCAVKVNHLEDVGKMDNTFNPIMRHEMSADFLEKATQSVNDMFGNEGIAGLNKRLKRNYQVLENVLDYSHSNSCQKKADCHLDSIENTLTFAQGEEPKTTGPIRLGTGAADSFILQYYEGYPLEEVAWGKIHSSEEWQAISDIKNLYTDLLFASPVVAKEAATPLATFIQNAFVNHHYQHPFMTYAQNAKFSLLVGHDSNVASLLSLLKIKPYHLEGQYEKTPISGKVVFERWKDNSKNRKLMKIEYLYQTTDQLRDGTPLNKENPPQSVILEMEDCPIDKNGFCPLKDFDKAIQKELL